MAAVRAKLTRENECCYFDAVPKAPPPLPEGRVVVAPLGFRTPFALGDKAGGVGTGESSGMT